MGQMGKFDKTRSPLARMYSRLSVQNPGELKEVFFVEDQKLMHLGTWDYKNPDLMPNQVRSEIESVGLQNVTDTKEREWLQEILWLWYHHAISCALWRYGDKETVLVYSAKALELQTPRNLNRITRLLYLLVRDELAKAERWTKTIRTDPEKTTARHLLDLYREGKFYDLQI